jgi:putative transcriptional regulator
MPSPVEFERQHKAKSEGVQKTRGDSTRFWLTSEPGTAMGKAGERILKAAQEALAIAEGKLRDGFIMHEPTQVDVKALRARLKMSQDRFAHAFGLPKWTVQDWEQGRRQPEGAARVLLKVIEREPDAVRRALAA